MSTNNIKAWLDVFLDTTNHLQFTVAGRRRVDAHWVFRNRRLDDHLIYFVVRQTMAGQASGQSLHLPAGSLLWLSPGIEHTVRNADPRRPFTVIHLRPMFTRLSCKPPKPFIHVLHDAWSLEPGMTALREQAHDTQAHHDLRCRALLAGLLIDTARLNHHTEQTQGLTQHQRERLLRLVNTDRQVRLSPADLAAHLGLTADYFARRFRQTFGVSPRSWIVHQRVQRAAATLLETNRTISQVADSFGYTDLFQFSRQFKAVTGQSPRTYRASR